MYFYYLFIIVLLLYNYCINCKPTFAHPCTFTVLSVFFKLTVYKIKNQSLVLFQLSVNCGDLGRVQRSEDHGALPVPPAPDTGVSAWRTVRPPAITPGPWFLISDCRQLSRVRTEPATEKAAKRFYSFWEWVFEFR